MTGRSLRLSFVALAGAVALGCNAHSLQAPNPMPQQETDQYYEVNPNRKVDILVMVDNSPSMNEEQVNLAKNFPEFMKQLQMIPGGLPDVHVGVISSDLGAGPTPLLGNCSTVAGDRALLSAAPKMTAGCGLNAGKRWIEAAADPADIRLIKGNYMGDLSSVFSCMAKLGVGGCGFEHQLQATRVALYGAYYGGLAADKRPAGSDVFPLANGMGGGADGKGGFLRDDAILAIIFLTDEDDCSGYADPKEPKSGLYSEDRPGETNSLRCAVFGHHCGGAMPDPKDGYTKPLADCVPSNERGRLIPVPEMVQSIKALKRRPDQQIIVSGLIGWNSAQNAQYKYNNINAGSMQMPRLQVDFTPICKTTNLGEAAAGIRMKAFLDAFGANGSFYPICQEDLVEPIRQIGAKLAAKLTSTCIASALVNRSPDGTAIAPECKVTERRPDPANPAVVNDVVLPSCDSGVTPSNTTPCWKLIPDSGCENSGVKIEVLPATYKPPIGSERVVKCLTCPDGNNDRCKK